MFNTFKDMQEVVAHVKSGKPLYYHAPLNYRPVMINARPFGKARVYIRGTLDYDGFTADAKHLDRFRRIAATHEKPCGAEGLTSYRIRGHYGWVMIGATDHEDAWKQAQFSSDRLNRADLQVWNGKAYEPIK